MKEKLSKTIDFCKKYWKQILVAIGIVAAGTCVLLYNLHLKEQRKVDKEINNVEYVDSAKIYHKIYSDEKFKELKKENEALYDSLKKYKEQVSYLVQFKYKKEYDTGKVITKIVEKTDTIVIAEDEGDVAVYEYSNNPNDSINYNLKIGSTREPNWYQLKTTINDKFTIVNKTGSNENNHITIDSDGKGDITDVVVFKKKEQRKMWDRFAIGPSVTAGYDLSNKRFGMMIGISATFDLTK